MLRVRGYIYKKDLGKILTDIRVPPTRPAQPFLQNILAYFILAGRWSLHTSLHLHRCQVIVAICSPISLLWGHVGRAGRQRRSSAHRVRVFYTLSTGWPGRPTVSATICSTRRRLFAVEVISCQLDTCYLAGTGFICSHQCLGDAASCPMYTNSPCLERLLVALNHPSVGLLHGFSTKHSREAHQS